MQYAMFTMHVMPLYVPVEEDRRRRRKAQTINKILLFWCMIQIVMLMVLIMGLDAENFPWNSNYIDWIYVKLFGINVNKNKPREVIKI